MIRRDPFSGEPGASAFFQLLAAEEERSFQVQRGFGVLRVEARRGIETARELVTFYRTVAGALRRTDRVQPIGGRALAAVLTDTEWQQAEAAGGRVREAIAAHAHRWKPAVGWACTRPGEQTWQDAWLSAGLLLVADGVVPAAA